MHTVVQKILLHAKNHKAHAHHTNQLGFPILIAHSLRTYLTLHRVLCMNVIPFRLLQSLCLHFHFKTRNFGSSHFFYALSIVTLDILLTFQCYCAQLMQHWHWSYVSVKHQSKHSAMHFNWPQWSLTRCIYGDWLRPELALLR